MPRFIIEREVPGAYQLTAEQLRTIAQKSREVICKIGTDIQWIQSYVAGDKLYCVYVAPNEHLIRIHAQMGNFPANRICKISSVIDPTTADS
jgi:hypothetical protein